MHGIKAKHGIALDRFRLRDEIENLVPGHC
jgi:hypothetical protein